MLRHANQSVLYLSTMGARPSSSLQSLPLFYHVSVQHLHYLRDHSFGSYSFADDRKFVATSADLRDADPSHIRFCSADIAVVRLLRLLSPSNVRQYPRANLPIHGPDLSRWDSIYIACDQFLSLLFLHQEFPQWVTGFSSKRLLLLRQVQSDIHTGEKCHETTNFSEVVREQTLSQARINIGTSENRRTSRAERHAHLFDERRMRFDLLITFAIKLNTPMDWNGRSIDREETLSRWTFDVDRSVFLVQFMYNKKNDLKTPIGHRTRNGLESEEVKVPG